MRQALVLAVLSFSIPRAALAAAPTFTNVSTSSGLAAVGAKAGWWFDIKFEDFDNDGYQDLVWADHSMANCAFLANQRNGTFLDVSKTAFPSGYGKSSIWNLQPVDFDNDGWVDLLLISGDTGGASHRNLGNGSFAPTQVQKAWDDANGHGTAVADINGDGHLDILYNRDPSVLLQGRLDGAFENVAARLGLNVRTGFSSTFADLDGDGKPDLFTYFCSGIWCSIGERAPRLFINNGRGGFVDRTGGSGLAGAPGVAAAALGDFDNDGDLDLFVTGILEASDTGVLLGRLYRNDGKGVFTDATTAASLPARFGTVTTYAQIPSRATWADLDNDGYLDLLMSSTVRTYGFRNTGAGTFEDVSSATGLGAIATRQAVAADYDNDGDLDVASVDTNRFLFRNETNNGNWLKVRLAGCAIKTAVGSRIWVYESKHLGDAKFLKGFREVIQANSHETPLEQHFGLDATKTYDIRVAFYPEDAIVEKQDIKIGQSLQVVCPAGTPPPRIDGGSPDVAGTNAEVVDAEGDRAAQRDSPATRTEPDPIEPEDAPLAPTVDAAAPSTDLPDSAPVTSTPQPGDGGEMRGKQTSPGCGCGVGRRVESSPTLVLLMLGLWVARSRARRPRRPLA